MTFDGEFSLFNSFQGEFTQIEVWHSGEVEPYEGSYEVSPRRTEQILETDQKKMNDDVTVHAIYESAVDNPAGGLSFTIGLP